MNSFQYLVSLSFVISLIQGCVLNPTECGQSCDWSNPRIWTNCTENGYPSKATDDVYITAEGNYEIIYSTQSNLELGSFYLGSSTSTGSQKVKFRLTDSTLSISKPSFVISKSGYLAIEASQTTLLQNPPIIETGALFSVAATGSDLTINYNGKVIADGIFEILSTTQNTPSAKVLIKSEIAGTGLFRANNFTLVGFSQGADVSTTSFQTNGRIFGYLKFTGKNYLNNGIIGYEYASSSLFTNVSLTGNAVLSSSSIINIVLQNETQHLMIAAQNITLDGSLVVVSSSNLVIETQTVIPLITGNFQGNFSKETLVFNSFSNRANCAFGIIYEAIANKVALNFESCDLIISDDGILGYDKKTMIYFGIALAIAIVLIIIVACVIRKWKDCREGLKGKRNFYNLKDEEYFKDFNKE